MNIREWMNNNSAVVAIGAVVLLAAALVYMLTGGGGNGPGGDLSKMYFLDLTTGEKVSMPADSETPITLPNGNQGVQAYVYSCNNCKDRDDLEPRYVQRLTPDALERAGGSQEKLDEMLLMGTNLFEVASPADAMQDTWYEMQSPQASQLMAVPPDFCDNGERPKLCRP